MFTSLVRTVLMLSLLVCVTGCPSFATRGSARTMKAGETELNAGLGMTSANPLAGPSLFSEDERYEFTGDDAYPLLELGAAVGLTDSVELGGRLMLTGAEVLNLDSNRAVAPMLAVDTKVQLVRADEPGTGLDVAVNPAVTAGYGSFEGQKLYTFLQVPVLLGVNLGERNQLVLSPQLTVAMPHLGLTAKQLVPSMGVAWLHRFDNGLGLRPELTVITPGDREGRAFQDATLQAGFTFLVPR